MNNDTDQLLLQKAIPIHNTPEHHTHSFFRTHIIKIMVCVFLLIAISISYLVYEPVKELFVQQKATAELESTPTVIPQSSLQNTKEIIGFLPSWTLADQSPIQTDKLTELFYFGLGINDDGTLIKYGATGSPVLEWQYLTGREFQDLSKKLKSQGKKVIVVIKNFDNQSIDTIISSDAATKRLSEQLASLLQAYHFDGVNLDFEYVTDSTFPTSIYLDKFLETISHALKKENTAYSLSIDVNATAVILDPAYDMAKIGAVVDRIIVMTYDYHQPSSRVAGPVAPLYANGNNQSVSKSIQSLIGRVTSEKIILGIPFYGYEWQTVSKNFESPTVPYSGALATYKRVKELIANRPDASLRFDDASQSPWLVYNQSGAIKEIYYENPKSIEIKMQYVKMKSLGGVAIWTLGYEGDNIDLWDALTE